jgi:hypothetical protein
MKWQQVIYGVLNNYLDKGRLWLWQCQVFRIFANSANKRRTTVTMNQILTQNSYLCIKSAKWYIVDWEIVLEIDNVHLRSQHTQDFFYNRNYDYYILFYLEQINVTLH